MTTSGDAREPAPGRSLPAVILDAIAGPAAGARIEARRGDIVEIGRATLTAPGTVGDRHMSGRHFAIVCAMDGCRIRDLGSTNGTFLNGLRVTDAVLQDGDRIEAGVSTFSVRLQETPVRDGVAAEAHAGSAARRDGPAGEVAPSPEGESVVGISASPIFQVTCDRPFAIATLPWEDLAGKARLTVVVKATFVIGPEPRLAPEPVAVFSTDVAADEPNLGVRFESDLVPFKPRTDIILIGRAYAPGGQPVTQLMAGLRVGAVRYAVAVFGDRAWEWRGLAPPTIAGPAPFTAMDLAYERAFGGIDGPGGMYCKDNLLGSGFIGQKTEERIHGLRLPNLEDSHDLIRSWESRPKPVGFGFYGRGWMPRLAHAGTYGDRHRASRAGAIPEDFSYAFFNGAHPALQVEGYLRGDEEVVLLNVCSRDPEMRFRLPGAVPKITVSRWTQPPETWLDAHLDPEGTLTAAPPLEDEVVTPVLDTLVFIPDEGIFYEVFRSSCSLASVESMEIARITVTA